MPRCPNPECGKEVEEGAVYCPHCGTKLAKAAKRNILITVCVILLVIFSLIHLSNMLDYATIYGDFSGSIGQLFFGAFALVAAYFLWKSEEIGGILGIVYAIFSMIAPLSVTIHPEAIPFEYGVYDIIFDVCSSIVLIIFLGIGWKSLK